MSDTYNANPLSFIFNGSDPNVNQQLRQRIALAMMSKQRRAPRNFGEGLSAIGDSLGEMGTMKQLLDADKASTAAGNAKADALLGTPPGEPPAGTSDATVAAPPSRTAYAPPADVPAEPAAPAAPPAEPAAPTALASLRDMPLANNSEGLTNTPAQPSSMLSPTPMLSTPIQTPPSTQFNPRDRAASVLAARPPTDPGADAGGPYNVIDALANFKRPGAGRVMDAAARAYPDSPDMQAYASSMASGEQTKPGDTSSTGARGPFQFVPGTARQYGLTNPDDINASTDAFKRFTADNAATFEKTNGRPPTMAELAVMHQQGGQTGANMIAGTGNASPRNLALNNVPPGSDPATAVAKIKSYYGVPDQVADPRTAVARVLAQGGDAPLPPAGPQQLSFSGAPTDATAAVNPQIRQAPPPPAMPPQVQPPAPGLPPAGYISPTPPEITPPRPVPMSPTEAKLRDAIARNPNDEQLARRLSPVIQTLEANRTAENTRAVEQYKIDLQGRNAMLLKIEEQKGGAEQSRLDADKARQEIRKGNLAEPIDVEGKVMRDPVTGLLTRPKIEGEDASQMPNVKLSEDQRKTLTFHGWASLADKMMQDPKTATLLAHGNAQELLGKTPVFGNQLQADEYRRAKNAANNFVLAFMRSTSGAAYGPKEAEDHARAMLPKPGDDAATIADKAAQRKNFVDTLYGGLGPGRQVADYLAKERKSNGPDISSAAMDARQHQIDEAMSKVKPLGFGDTRTNKKGVTRTWNGSHWVEM